MARKYKPTQEEIDRQLAQMQPREQKFFPKWDMTLQKGITKEGDAPSFMRGHTGYPPKSKAIIGPEPEWAKRKKRK